MRQVFYVPDPNERSRAIVPTVAPTTGYYKLVAVYERSSGESSRGGVEVLTLGGEEEPSWRQIESGFFQAIGGSDTVRLVEQGGVVHCCKTNDYEVTSLDLDTERFCGRSRVRRSRFLASSYVWFVECDEGVSLAAVWNSEFHVLGFRDFRKGKWEEEKRVIPLRFLEEDPELRRDIRPFLSFYLQNQRIGFVLRNSIEIIYSVEEKRIVCATRTEGRSEAILGQDSLVTFKGMKPSR